MDVATMKKDLENQIGDINKELKNIYLPLEAVLILLGKRTAFQIALGLIDSLQQEQKPAWSEEDEKKIHFLSRLIEFQVKNDEYCFSEGRFVSKKEAIKMLKSLRPSWKPSEEQPQVANASKMEESEVDLEKAFAHEYAIYHLPNFIIASIADGTELIDFIYKTARHFAEWGAAHARKEDK